MMPAAKITIISDPTVIPNRARPLPHFAGAADQGYEPAQNNLCRIYFYGIGVVRDEKQAAYWCEKAAEAGFGEAQNNLGTLYMTGRGVPQDKTLAEKWFQQAADQGFPQAKRNLTILSGEPKK